jgi:hypothetical protein
MNAQLDWETVKEFYQEQFGIEGWVVEVYASLDILTLCVSGASNETITKFLEVPIADVKKVIQDTLDFDGWDEDLPISPYNVYNSMSSRWAEDSFPVDFINSLIHLLMPYPKFRNLNLLYVYKMCKTSSDIERKIHDEWI